MWQHIEAVKLETNLQKALAAASRGSLNMKSICTHSVLQRPTGSFQTQGATS